MTQELERNDAGLPVRELGKTGLKVSIVGFGGGNFVRPNIDEPMSIRLVQAAIDAGMTFMDNAFEYADGEAERRMGLALKGRRDQVTLMTKVCARDRKTAQAELEESLRISYKRCWIKILPGTPVKCPSTCWMPTIAAFNARFCPSLLRAALVPSA